MNRKRAVFILLLGLVAGLIATVGASRYMSKGGTGAPSRPAAELAPVVIAKSNVPEGEKLKKSDLGVVSWPASVVLPSAVRKIEDAENRVTLARLIKGEPVLASKLAPLGTSPGLSSLIRAGMRGVTVRVNDVIGVAGFLLPGSRVDVLITIEVARRAGRPNTVTKMVLQNIKVLAVGSRTITSGEGPRGKKPIKVSVVTLLVTPTQAERLTLASTRGQILLALRNNLDSAAVDTPGITPPELLFGDVPPPPEPKPKVKEAKMAPKPSLRPLRRHIEVIRGGEKSRESWAQQLQNGGARR